MKINDSNSPGVSSPGIGKPPAVEESVKSRQSNLDTSSSSSPDQVQVSGLGQALRAADPNSPERAAHLEKLSADIESGRYKVDSTEIAKSIIKDALKDG